MEWTRGLGGWSYSASSVGEMGRKNKNNEGTPESRMRDLEGLPRTLGRGRSAVRRKSSFEALDKERMMEKYRKNMGSGGVDVWQGWM